MPRTEVLIPCRYDVSGVPPDKIEEIIKFDWKHLVFNKRIFDSPSYLREKGKPVVALWGTIILSSPLPHDSQY